MGEFKAIRVNETQAKLVSLKPAELSPGDVEIAVEYSSINYKDALAITGKGAILKSFPLNAGIDAAGEVIASSSPRFNVGDRVLITGTGLGETFDGGLAQRVRAPASSPVLLPKNLTAREAMIYGTAGFTAALAAHRLLAAGQKSSMGPIVVTGAGGGVGQFSVALLAALGFEVWAVTSKISNYQKLRSLGAAQVGNLNELELRPKPLAKARFGGAIDNLGGEILPQLMASVQLWGNVASIGLATGHEFSSSVFPHILRGVSLLGISSNNTPMELRLNLWQKLAGAWRPRDLHGFVTQEITLEEVPEICDKMILNQTAGRYLVRPR